MSRFGWRAEGWRWMFGGFKLREPRTINSRGATEWTKVGNELFDLLRGKDLDPYDKAVLLALVEQVYRYKNPTVYGNHQDVAEAAGVSERHVRTVLERLADREIIYMEGYRGKYAYSFVYGDGQPADKKA